MPDYTATSATTSTWTLWNGIYTSNSGTATITSTIPSGTSTTNVTDLIWTGWNTTYTTYTGGGVIRSSTPPPTPMFRPGRVEYVEGERARAKGRAEVLLREALNPKQREQLKVHGFFDLEAVRPSGDRRIYRIRRGRSRNVQQITPDGQVLKTLCAHPVVDCPDADTMLAQKLWLETKEDEFLRLANHS